MISSLWKRSKDTYFACQCISESVLDSAAAQWLQSLHATMSRGSFRQVEDWYKVVKEWLALGSLWLLHWSLEGASVHKEGYWIFFGGVEIPFNKEDEALIESKTRGEGCEAALELLAMFWSDWSSKATQLTDSAQIGLMTNSGPSRNLSWRPQARREIPHLPVGLRNQDDGSPYAGIGTQELERRFRALVRMHNGYYLEMQATKGYFYKHRVIMYVLLAFL